MVEVQSLRKRFGPVAAVDGVSFTAVDGQITGLLGENGAGKTTTLAMIGGVLTPDGGSVQIDGVDANARATGVGAWARCSTTRGCTHASPRARTSGTSGSSTVCPDVISTSACRTP